MVWGCFLYLPSVPICPSSAVTWSKPNTHNIAPGPQDNAATPPTYPQGPGLLGCPQNPAQSPREALN